MKLSVVSVGRLKEPFYKAAAAEYKKRLSRFVKLEDIEVKDASAPERLSNAQMDAVKLKEGEAILSRIAPGEYVVALDVTGKRFTSEEFAGFLAGLELKGRAAFAIGGSLGLHKCVLERADARISLSDMTFCHQLARVVLLEQIYRACKINAGEAYHK